MPEKKDSHSKDLVCHEGKDIKVGIDPFTSLLSHIETRSGRTGKSWLSSPMSLTVRNEATNQTASFTQVHVKETPQGVLRCKLEPFLLRSRNSGQPLMDCWELNFWERTMCGMKSPGSSCALPNSPGLAPSNRESCGHDYPIQACSYATYGLSWKSFTLTTFCLWSIFDEKRDRALTIAPADVQILISKSVGRIAGICGSRSPPGMGGGGPLNSCSTCGGLPQRPQRFYPTLPRAPTKGFYYHHPGSSLG
jgi:hypothetical protein